MNTQVYDLYFVLRVCHVLQLILWTMKKFKFFIGIDVSKNKLDVAVLHADKFEPHSIISNTPQGIKEWFKQLKSRNSFMVPRAVFGMEHTGLYANHLLNYLKSKKAFIVVENAMKIRNSLGILRGKNDKIDAIRIAQYLYRSREHLKPWRPRRMVVEQLAHLATLRNRLLTMQKVLSTPLKEGAKFWAKSTVESITSLCANSSATVTNDIIKLDEKIKDIIQSDEEVKRLHKLITSVPGVGTTTALQIIVYTNEFQSIRDPKKFACFAGVAPFKKSSGLIEGKAKISSIANRKVKSLLHLCALAAVRSDATLKEYFIRKTTGEGKPKLAVYNAVRNKIVLRIFACVNNDKIYQKEIPKHQLANNLAQDIALK